MALLSPAVTPIIVCLSVPPAGQRGERWCEVEEAVFCFTHKAALKLKIKEVFKLFSLDKSRVQRQRDLKGIADFTGETKHLFKSFSLVVTVF